MHLQTPKNINYCATVVRLDKLVPLAGCDNVQGAIVFGTQVIVGKDQLVGDIGLYFPPEVALAAPFLSANNLYRKPEWGNVDPAKRGYFEEHGRVRCVRFRGHRSEGIWLPIHSLAACWVLGYMELKPGDTFDCIDKGNGEVIEVCHKYVARRNPGRAFVGEPKRKRVEDAIVDGQFAFHYDTSNLRRNIGILQPNDWISISDKWHGTSVIIGNLLTKRPLPWYERLAKILGVQVLEARYGLVWSSRKVVKGVAGEAKVGSRHWYDSDPWGAWARVIGDRIPPGYTIYGEIVGFTPTGGAIQGGYSYGCTGNDSRLLVYRVTITQVDGTVFEMPWDAMTAWAIRNDLETVKELWYGRARDLGLLCQNTVYTTNDAWHEQVLKYLEEHFVHDQDCAANPGMPAEGIVLRIDRGLKCGALKLKNLRFLEHETKQLDKGAVDIEEDQTAETEPDAEASK